MVQNARILVVDDDEVLRNTLAILLEQEGYTVDKVKNGQEAIAKSQSDFYNLAIVDWRLPDFEGTKLLAALKETVPKMAKIMLTGYPSMDNAVAAVNNRADAFFMKPVDFETLAIRIKELLTEQEEENNYSEAKVAEFIETRTKYVIENKTNKKLTSPQ
jgi:DNA-binding NtrC family response regulator